MSNRLEQFNLALARGIEAGRIGGPGLDARIIHREQTIVQEQLDYLKRSDEAAYNRVVRETNSMMNPKGVLGFFSNWYPSDRSYQEVLMGVREKLGRDIDFAKQGDREAVGKALVDRIRDNGGCTRTGSRFTTC